MKKIYLALIIVIALIGVVIAGGEVIKINKEVGIEKDVLTITQDKNNLMKFNYIDEELGNGLTKTCVYTNKTYNGKTRNSLIGCNEVSLTKVEEAQSNIIEWYVKNKYKTIINKIEGEIILKEKVKPEEPKLPEDNPLNPK